MLKDLIKAYSNLPKVVLILSLGTLIIAIAEIFYVPILPLYAKTISPAIPLIIVGVAASIHRLGQVISSPITGNWSDRIGRTKPYILGIIITSITDFLAGTAFGIPDLMLYRILSGIGYGMFAVAAMGYIADVTTRENRATAMGLYVACMITGLAIGPLAGGYIAEFFNFRATFYASGIVQLITGIAILLAIRRVGVDTTVNKIQQANVSFWATIRNKGILSLSISNLPRTAGLSAFLYITLPLLGESWGLSSSIIGWMLSAFGFGHILGALYFGPLSDRAGKRKPFVFAGALTPGILLLIIGVGNLPGITNTSNALFLIILLTFLIGLSASANCSALPAMAAELASKTPATSIGFARSLEVIGFLIGPILGGYLIDTVGYSSSVLIYGALPIIASFLILFGIKESVR